MKSFIKSFIPPFVFKQIVAYRGRNYGWSGDFESWKEASLNTQGYDAQKIFDKVSSAILQVKSGKRAYERDSVLFDKVQYSWPMLSGLMWIAALNKGNLNLIDFGGSLGSTYFQNLQFLKDLNVEWNIVEQNHFVEFGKNHVADERLSFFRSIEECLEQKKVDTILLSSVLPYVEKPYVLIDNIINTGFEWIIVDRTPTIEQTKDRLTIQKVHPEIYEASYPCWMFSDSNLKNRFSEHYKLVEEFDALAGKVLIRKPTSYYLDKGFIFRRKH